MHLKSQKRYFIEYGPDRARLEKDGTPVYIYRSALPGDPTVWVRDALEMEDGRFAPTDGYGVLLPEFHVVRKGRRWAVACYDAKNDSWYVRSPRAYRTRWGAYRALRKLRARPIPDPDWTVDSDPFDRNSSIPYLLNVSLLVSPQLHRRLSALVSLPRLKEFMQELLERAVAPKPDMPRVVCAAMRNDLGDIICGARHFDSRMHAMIKLLPPDLKDWHGAEQGFINTRGEFLTRAEAWEVAKAHGQIIRDHDKCVGELFSEHLY